MLSKLLTIWLRVVRSAYAY